ncbi:MAG: alpha/beta fold hydrolase [Oscillatoriales cyanobacterium C42_A2020_001]|nr:alpha/beta fold hydrolase [Leptolyngbyaceae cyanobacterium C42_A2020_001]
MKHQPWQWMRSLLVLLITSYGLACLGLFVYQRHLIFHPTSTMARLPSAEGFKLPYEDVWITIPGSRDRLHAWWLPSPAPQETIATLPDEPVRVLRSPKVLVFLCGAGGNKSNYLARIEGLRQLGFAVFVADYRGYGKSEGSFPNEAQLYADSELIWNYLTQTRQIAPNQIVLYGESLGGAIAIHLATKHPNAKGLIVQSSFTSMASVAKRRPPLGLFLIHALLTERFDSLTKVRSLQTPVLFIHGKADALVPVEMSQQLYDATTSAKRLHLIPNAEHVRIYQPGDASYLKAIARFVVEMLN